MKNEMRSEITYLSLVELLFSCPVLGRIKPASEFHQMEGYVAWVVSRKLKLNPHNIYMAFLLSWCFTSTGTIRLIRDGFLYDQTHQYIY